MEKKRAKLRNGHMVKWLHGYINHSAIQLFNHSKPRLGFSLIELLIVIAVVGILAIGGMAVINPLGQIQKAHDAQRKHDLVQIQQALDAYYADNNKYPNSADVLNTDGSIKYKQIIYADWGLPWTPYIAKLPKDPTPNQNYYFM